MERPRRCTYPLSTYLNDNKEGDISNDVDTQRKPAWKPIVNGLIVTVLTDDYIPPIILGEDEDERKHILDGGSRTAALMMFKYGNHKISSSLEDGRELLLPAIRECVLDVNLEENRMTIHVLDGLLD